MADTSQVGLSYGVNADVSKFTEAMKKADDAVKQTGGDMARAFDDASKASEKSVESFAGGLIDKTVAAIRTLQTVSQKMGEAWEAGSDGAEKAVTAGFNAIFSKAEGGMEALVAKIPGIWGKIGVGIYEVLKGSGAIDQGFEYLKKKAATALESLVDSAQLAKISDKISGAFAELGKSTLQAGAGAGFFDDAKLKESEAQVDTWAGSIKSTLDDLAEGARTALQKLAGTFTGVGDAVKKAVDDLNKKLERQKELQELIGKDAGEQAALRAKWEIVEKSGKAWDDLNEKEKEAAIAAATNAANIAAESDALRKAAQDEKERERSITSVTASLQRQAQMQLANADAITKTAYARALERAQAQAQGTGRKANVSDHPTVIAAQESFAQSAQTAAQIKFNTELAETIRKSNDAYLLETQSLGQNVLASTAAKFAQEQENIARKDGIAITDELRQMIDASSLAVAKNAQMIAEAKDRYSEFMQVGKTVASSLEGEFAKFTQTGKFSFSDMIKSMLQDLEKLAFRMALMPIFGGGTANPGGLLGNLLGATFGGGKAEGGPLESGKWYIAGEKGPEPIWGGGSGAFASGYGGGSSGGGGGRSDINMNINLAGANGDETIARIASQAAQQAYAAAVQTNRAGMPKAQRQYQMLGA